ncbi:MAG: GIY-YIG nuclease family protein [Candidatus Pacebacteria bacterium]|nr:GIY-YIG nuclease family protein [Candidatus Paceibacterota bacterium]MBP9839931.1 GIY-YIG nuclease family protein [Candidatus Paceibacterota bacterium]MDQ5922592.1 putative endonuclease [Patescibacteria group bacterium]
MWFVYILKCEDGSFYTGISNNPERRFLEHKNRKGGHYTSSHKVIEIVYLEECIDKSTALKRERQIKGWSRKKKLLLIDKMSA